MNRGRTTLIVATLLAIGLGVWIARNTAWVTISMPLPPRGEAARNPFYAAQRFAEALGATTFWDQTLQTPPAGAVLVLSRWRWSLSDRRRAALEGWVEAGGRLVVDRSVMDDPAFATWSGITPSARQASTDTSDASGPDTAADRTSDAAARARTLDDRCKVVHVANDADVPLSDRPMAWQLCGADWRSALRSERSPTWALRDEDGNPQALRVAVGRGSVTAINASPFRRRGMVEGDHGRIFVAATQLRRGDTLRFLSEDDHPSLLALIWQQGAPIVLLTLSAIGLALWRGAARFGPPAPPDATARRSLAEQILGTGQFALRLGDTAALHASLVRGVDDAARQRVPGYHRLSPTDRAAAIAALAGMDAAAIDAALSDPDGRRPERVRGTIALLELARRRTLVAHTRSPHGTE